MMDVMYMLCGAQSTVRDTAGGIALFVPCTLPGWHIGPHQSSITVRAVYNDPARDGTTELTYNWEREWTQ